MTEISISQELIEAIEDFCDIAFDVDTYKFGKAVGLDEAMAEKLKDSIEILTKYRDYLPSDVLQAIQDIIKFALEISEKPDDETKADDKIKKSHDWGFSLIPDDFRKEERSRSQRIRKKKTGVHNWGFSLSDNDQEIEKDEDTDEDDED